MIDKKLCLLFSFVIFAAIFLDKEIVQYYGIEL